MVKALFVVLMATIAAISTIFIFDNEHDGHYNRVLALLTYTVSISVIVMELNRGKPK